MRRALGWTLVPMLLLASCTGYGTLVQEWKGYDASPYYHAQIRPRPVEKVAEKTKDAEFEAQVARLREMKARWEEALKEEKAPLPFYSPSQERLRAFSPAATDAAAAAKALKGGFSAEDLELLVYLRSPGIREAQKRLRAALEQYDQVSNLDEILRQYTAFTEGLMTGVGPMKGREPVELKFPFPGVLALKGEIVTQEVKAEAEALEIARRTAITAARKSYWNLLYVRSAKRIVGEMLALLERLDSVATVRYQTGRTSFQDVVKVRIERELLGEDLQTLAQEQRNWEVKILELLDLPPTVQVGAPLAREPGRRVPDVEALYPVASERRQELRRLRARVAKMERLIEMAETQIYPSFSLNLSLFQDEAISQVGTFGLKEPFSVTTTASVGAGLPKMPWYGRNDAYLRETRQRLEALKDELRKAEDETFNGVREAWFRLDRARREEALYAQRVVDLSRSALDVSTKGYETGEVSFADVIASYTLWLKANLSRERKRSDLGVARAGLEEAVGAPW